MVERRLMWGDIQEKFENGEVEEKGLIWSLIEGVVFEEDFEVV